MLLSLNFSNVDKYESKKVRYQKCEVWNSFKLFWSFWSFDLEVKWMRHEKLVETSMYESYNF